MGQGIFGERKIPRCMLPSLSLVGVDVRFLFWKWVSWVNYWVWYVMKFLHAMNRTYLRLWLLWSTSLWSGGALYLTLWLLWSTSLWSNAQNKPCFFSCPLSWILSNLMLWHSFSSSHFLLSSHFSLHPSPPLPSLFPTMCSFCSPARVPHKPTSCTCYTNTCVILSPEFVKTPTSCMMPVHRLWWAHCLPLNCYAFCACECEVFFPCHKYHSMVFRRTHRNGQSPERMFVR